MCCWQAAGVMVCDQCPRCPPCLPVCRKRRRSGRRCSGRATVRALHVDVAAGQRACLLTYRLWHRPPPAAPASIKQCCWQPCLMCGSVSCLINSSQAHTRRWRRATSWRSVPQPADKILPCCLCAVCQCADGPLCGLPVVCVSTVTKILCAVACSCLCRLMPTNLLALHLAHAPGGDQD